MQLLRVHDDIRSLATMAPDRRGCGVGWRELRVAVRLGSTYQIFTVASEPRTLVSAENDNSCASLELDSLSRGGIRLRGGSDSPWAFFASGCS